MDFVLCAHSATRVMWHTHHALTVGAPPARAVRVPSDATRSRLVFGLSAGEPGDLICEPRDAPKDRRPARHLLKALEKAGAWRQGEGLRRRSSVDDVQEQGHPDALRARAEQLIARSKKLAAAAEALRRDAAQFAKTWRSATTV